MCFTDRHDMTLAITVVLNPNTTNQPTRVLLAGTGDRSLKMLFRAFSHSLALQVIPIHSVVGSESRPSSRGIFVT